MGVVLGVSPSKGFLLSKKGTDGHRGGGVQASGADKLASDLGLASIRLSPKDVRIAGRTLALILSGIMLTLTTVLTLTKGLGLGISLGVSTAIIPIIAKEWLTSYPARVAAKRAQRMLRHSAEAVNLMIMSLRHEPSITNAIAFASTSDNAFSKELKGCTWNVITGKCESFEEALFEMGNRWSRLGEDLKTSLNSMVTSSREATQDGRRRALDRANQAMISGGKRRIEEYAMSLTTPSMLIFGLGILLPLMVGSFLPMLSWDIWSMDGMTSDDGLRSENRSAPQTIMVMNLLFPAIAYTIAANAVSDHPLEQTSNRSGQAHADKRNGLFIVSISCAFCAWMWFAVEDSIFRSVFLLFSAVGPLSIWLALRAMSSQRGDKATGGVLEDVLFRTGARMLEGENFESSLDGAARELSRGRPEAARVLSLTNILATGGSELESSECASFGERNAVEGLRITRDAASKDETAAGALAMDLASYLKDLRDLESTLRNRIKPTISMMKTTALVLAPIVLGVTYAIYLSLASMLEAQRGDTDASMFFLVLGIFLAQMNTIVAYFVWGIEGRRDVNMLAAAAGGYVIVSELVFSATALLASA